MTLEQAYKNGELVEKALRGAHPKKQAETKRISVDEAAKRLGITKDAICKGMIQKSLPIGFIVVGDNGKNSYYIFESLLDAYIVGRLAITSASPIYLW